MDSIILTKEMVARAYDEGLIKIVPLDVACRDEKPSEYEPVIKIGDKWFFAFGQEAETMTVAEYVSNVPKDDIISEIYTTIRTISQKDFDYCLSYINERLSSINERPTAVADPYVGKTFMFTATAEDMAFRNGQVLVQRKLRPDEYDEAETGPMYEVKSVADGSVFQVFEDELSSPVAFDALVKALPGSFPVDTHIHFASDEDGIIMFCPNAASVTLMQTSAEMVALFIKTVTKEDVTVTLDDADGICFRIAAVKDKT